MTPRQVAELYFCPRDEKGAPILGDHGPGLGDREMYLMHLYKIGITDPAQQDELYRASRRQPTEPDQARDGHEHGGA